MVKMREVDMTTKDEQLIITKYDLLFESRLTRVETTLENVNTSIIKLENKIDNVKTSFEKSLNDSKEAMTKSVSEVKTDFRWMFGLWVSFSIVMLGLVFKAFH